MIPDHILALLTGVWVGTMLYAAGWLVGWLP